MDLMQDLVVGLIQRSFGAAKASKHKRKIAESAAAEIGGVQATLAQVLQGHQSKRSLLMGKSAAVFSVHMSSATKLVATGGADGTVRLWHSRSPETGQVLIETGAPIHRVQFSADGSMLAAGGNDKQLRIWDFSRGLAVARQLPGTWQHKGLVLCLDWSPDGRNVVAADSSGRVTVGRPGSAEGRTVTKAPASATGVSDVSFFPNGAHLAFAAGRTIAIMEASGGRQVRTLPIGKHTADSVACSPLGQLLAAGLSDGTVRVWRTVDGEQIHVLGIHAPWTYDEGKPLGKVSGLAFSPNGRLLASGGWDGVVKIWQVDDGKLLRNIVPKRGLVHALAWSADDAQLAVATHDGTAQLWSIQ